MKKLATFALIVGLAACSKKGGGGSDCDTQIGKAMDAMKSKAADSPMKAQIEEKAGKIREVMVKHCTEDKWPAEVTTCLGGVQNQRGIRECTDKLPADVKGKMMNDLMAVMVGPGHEGMGMPGHPGGLHGADGAGSGAPPAGSADGSAAATTPPAPPAAPAPAAPAAGSN